MTYGKMFSLRPIQLFKLGQKSHVDHSVVPHRVPRWGKGHMGQISVEIPPLTGSILGGNQHQDIEKFIARQNADPKPLRWTKSADDILATIERFCRRTLDVHS